MLVSMPEKAAQLDGPIEPTVVCAAPAPATEFAVDADDDDEALQAILLASLQEEQQQLEAAQQASAKACEEQEARFAAAVKPPLVAKAVALGEFCSESNNLNNDVKSSLATLGQPPHCLMLAKVRGDGHCLFRVVGAALVLGAAWSGRAAMNDLAEHLSARMATDESTAATEVARLVLELMREADVLAALNDEDPAGKPAQLVGALRRCAVDHMRSDAERFRHCAEGGEGEGDAVWEAYCSSMRDVAQTRYGGHPELVALSESLQIRVAIYDTGALSGSMATYHLGEHLPEACPIARGLRRGPHFDLLLQATPDAAEPTSPEAPALS